MSSVAIICICINMFIFKKKQLMSFISVGPTSLVGSNSSRNEESEQADNGEDEGEGEEGEAEAGQFSDTLTSDNKDDEDDYIPASQIR